MMQHSTTISAAATAAGMGKAAKRSGVVTSLQGPRPLPLSLPDTTTSSPPLPRPAKRPRVIINDAGGDDDDVRVRAQPAAARGPVILYEHTPKVIHARPDEFKALVQRLTGRQPTTGTAAAAGGGHHEEAMVGPAQTAAALSSQQEQDPLVLTLGQQHVPAPLPLLDDHHTPPSPGGAGGFLLSPGSFLFSPATMQAIHELIS